MVSVLLNYRRVELWDWHQLEASFKVMPRVGEYVALSETEGWYRVELVVHNMNNPETHAMIYAVDAGMSALTGIADSPLSELN